MQRKSVLNRLQGLVMSLASAAFSCISLFVEASCSWINHDSTREKAAELTKPSLIIHAHRVGLHQEQARVVVVLCGAHTVDPARCSTRVNPCHLASGARSVNFTQMASGGGRGGRGMHFAHCVHARPPVLVVSLNRTGGTNANRGRVRPEGRSCSSRQMRPAMSNYAEIRGRQHDC